jgi:triphosphoribosyl-dephospho-CoA synthetase
MAEEKMYAATNGINTHKGAIYSLGIICLACGYVYDSAQNLDAKEVLDLCKVMAGNTIDAYILETKAHDKNTNGEKAYLNHNIKGARGEASAGFPSVVRYALPALNEKINEKWAFNNAALFALLTLIANVDDTNIVARSDVETLRNIQKKVREILLIPNLSEVEMINYLSGLNREFVDLNISPGGSADLLSVTLFLYFISFPYLT